MLAYRHSGKGNPILFLHGVGLSAECWFNQTAELSKYNSVYAVDLPGHGRSPLFEDGQLSMSALCQELALFQKSEIGGPAVIVGHSLGALICLEYAALYPDLVNGIIPVSAVYKRPPAAMAAVKSRSERLLNGNHDKFIADAPIVRWFGEQPTGHLGQMAELCRNWLLSAKLEGYAAAYHVFANQCGAADETLEQIKAPALFVTGADDPNSTPEMSAALSKKAKNGRFKIIDDARHMPQLTHYKTMNRTIHRFVQDCYERQV